jgi:hypothetical protein
LIKKQTIINMSFIEQYQHEYNLTKKIQLMLYNMMIGCYDIYDRFTTEHFTLRQGIPNFDGQFFLLTTVPT